MEDFTEDLSRIIGGEPSTEVNIIDHAEERDTNFVPIVKRNVGYVVCCIVFNRCGEILLVQEAKRSCYGKWYLPAGRLEAGETLLQGVQREVTEESGLEINPDALITIEAGPGLWFRFTFLGTIIGGQLKTFEQRDSESLQAKWFSISQLTSKDDPDFVLRARDILPLVDVAMQYKTSVLHGIKPPLAATRVHKRQLLRLLICQKGDDDMISILTSSTAPIHLPTTFVSSTNHQLISATIAGFLKEIFPKAEQLPIDMTISGVVSMEYNGVPKEDSNGFCMSIVIAIKGNPRDSRHIEPDDKYSWFDIKDKNVQKVLMSKMEPQSMSIIKLLSV